MQVLHGIVKDVRTILQNTKEYVYIPDLALEPDNQPIQSL